MEKYRVINQPITLYSGILDLTLQQAESRAASLVDLGEGLFEIIGPVQFKAGEEIGYDGEVTKALLEKLQPIDEPVEEAAEEPQTAPKSRKK